LGKLQNAQVLSPQHIWSDAPEHKLLQPAKGTTKQRDEADDELMQLRQVKLRHCNWNAAYFEGLLGFVTKTETEVAGSLQAIQRRKKAPG
jgi:hypothetical protein